MSAFAKDQVVTGKSVYQSGKASRRARGWMLTATVVVLLIAAFAWMTVYTRALESTRPDAASRAIDPARPIGPAATTSGATAPAAR